MESILKYRSYMFENLTSIRNPDEGHCLVGSLTGVVASQIVTEAFKGMLSVVSTHTSSANVKSMLNCETNKSSRDESRS